MATDKEYLQYVMERFAPLQEVSARAMMGEYILYYKGKVVGGIYDDRLLIKPTDGAKALLPTAPLELPYQGAKPMLLVTEIDDGELLSALLGAVYRDLYDQ